MTPNPDTASPDTTVLDALKLMNEGHYLNLPVLDNGIVIGMVDVLKLTYVTLEQMNGMDNRDGPEGINYSTCNREYVRDTQNIIVGGPMWGRFWDSFSAVDNMESSSQLSDSSSHMNSRSMISNNISPQPSTSLSQLKSYSDISPNESASMVNYNNDQASSIVMDGGPDTFTFKFTSAGQKTHRVVCKPAFNELLECVRVKLIPEHGDDVGDEEWLTMSYLDDEEDQVLMSCDADVSDSVHLARKVGQTRVKLIVQDQKSSQPQSISPSQVTTTNTTVKTAPVLPVSSQQIEKPAPKKKKVFSSSPSSLPPKKDHSLLLPAAIGFLGVVILGVFAISRVQQHSSKN